MFSFVCRQLLPYVFQSRVYLSFRDHHADYGNISSPVFMYEMHFHWIPVSVEFMLRRCMKMEVVQKILLSVNQNPVLFLPYMDMNSVAVIFHRCQTGLIPDL